MEAVYGRKRQAADGVSWMDRFTQLEPEGGFRATARLAWSRTAPMSGGLPPESSRNGHIELKPLYGRKGGNGKTWMDRFTKLNPEGGLRAVVERAWKRGTPTKDERPAILAAAMALFETSARQH